MTECERLIAEGKFDRDFFKEEVSCDFLVTTQRKKIWAIGLDLFNQFRSVCNKLGLRYFAIYGTLLGAVRHHGFIPWDDDLDVCLPREDYDILLHEASNYINDPYFFQSPLTDKGCAFSFCKLRNSNTSFLDGSFNYAPFNHGLSIDIFPLDNSPNEGYLERRDKIYQIIKNCSAFMKKDKLYKTQEDILKLSQADLVGFDPVESFKAINAIASQNNHDPLNNYSVQTLLIYKPENNLWPATCFDSFIEQPFENTTINIPSGYDKILSINYGNYMQFPPKEERGLWHSGEFNADIPYKERIASLNQ